MTTPLHELYDSLVNKEPRCSFECDAMLLGFLVKTMKDGSYFSRCPDPEYPGLCFADVHSEVTAISVPRWAGPLVKEDYQKHYSEESHCRAPTCTIQDYMTPITEAVGAALQGLDLKDFQTSR